MLELIPLCLSALVAGFVDATVGGGGMLTRVAVRRGGGAFRTAICVLGHQVCIDLQLPAAVVIWLELRDYHIGFLFGEKSDPGQLGKMLVLCP
jgi:hypothetical protein